MKFDKAIVLAGSKIRDQLAVRKHEEDISKLLETREAILESWSADQLIIEERARELLRKAELGEVITREELSKFNARDKNEDNIWRNNTLGLDKASLDATNKKIEAAEAMRLTAEKSRLTRFLEMIEEDKVSDYAIRGAGFKVRLADLFMLGSDSAGQEDDDAAEQTA